MFPRAWFLQIIFFQKTPLEFDERTEFFLYEPYFKENSTCTDTDIFFNTHYEFLKFRMWKHCSAGATVACLELRSRIFYTAVPPAGYEPKHMANEAV